MATSGDRILALAAALAVALAARSASAREPSATDVATARELYRQGADALDAGNPKLAIEKLTQAWALVHTPVIGADLARAQKATGHLLEAREAALAVERLPVAQDETARSTQARTDAERLANELAPRIPHVKLVLRGVGDGHTANVTLDGAALSDPSLAVPRDADPGEHVLRLDADDGRHAEVKVTLVEGETKEVVLTVDPPAAPPPPPRPIVETHAAPTVLAPPPPPARARISPIVWAGIATTGVGLVTGGITGAFAVNESSIVKLRCTSTGADGKFYCPPSSQSDLDAANALGVVSTVAFIVGGVGVAVLLTGVVLSSSGSHHGARARVVPFVGPVSGLAGTF